MNDRRTAARTCRTAPTACSPATATTAPAATPAIMAVLLLLVVLPLVVALPPPPVSTGAQLPTLSWYPDTQALQAQSPLPAE